MEAVSRAVMKFCRVFVLFSILTSALCIYGAVAKTTTGRKLTTVFNPDCDIEECKTGINGSFANLVYIKAEGSTDTLHYLLSSIRVPSVVVVRGRPGSSINVNWADLLSDNITEQAKSITLIGEELDNSFGVLFTRMLEYDDVDDEASLSSYFNTPNTTIDYTFHEFLDYSWDLVNKTVDNPNSAVFTHPIMKMEGDGMNSEGMLSLTFNLHDTTGRSSLLPKMAYNLNNTLLDVMLNNLTVMYNHSRFAMETVVMGTKKEDHKVTETKSLDDEYTPGVFKMFDWSTNPKDKKNGGYLEWKPICYTSTNRERLSGTFVDSYTLTDAKLQKKYIEQSIAYAYFGERVFNDLQLSGNNISFGLAKDGYYVKKNYTVWSSSIGYGTPPQDKISILVISVISAGLGLPVIIILFGGIYVICKKNSKKAEVMGDLTTSYTRINS